jgi:hypothetical protein
VAIVARASRAAIARPVALPDIVAARSAATPPEHRADDESREVPRVDRALAHDVEAPGAKQRRNEARPHDVPAGRRPPRAAASRAVQPQREPSHSSATARDAR